MIFSMGTQSFAVSVDDVVVIVHDSNWKPSAYLLQGTLAGIPLDLITKQDLVSEFPRQTGSNGH
jgi:hypothetical protein